MTALLDWLLFLLEWGSYLSVLLVLVLPWRSS